MRLIQIDPKATRNDPRPRQIIKYVCESCADDYGVRIPRNVENVKILTLLGSDDERGRSIEHECSHPDHAAAVATNLKNRFLVVGGVEVWGESEAATEETAVREVLAQIAGPDDDRPAGDFQVFEAPRYRFRHWQAAPQETANLLFAELDYVDVSLEVSA